MVVKTDEFPLIKCLPREDFDGGLKFWCPFCRKWHRHGRGDGHRSAHCTASNSPFNAHGYFIELMSKKELKEIKKAIDETLDLENFEDCKSD
jgi:hypothetical protein